MENNKIRYVCKICEKTFNVKSNLKRHISSKHQNSGNQTFICLYCSKNFTSKSNLTRHIFKCRNSDKKTNKTKKVKCVLCNKYEDSKTNLLSHYSSNHDINTSTKKFEFANFVEFEKWKDQIEKETVSKYVKFDSTKTSNKIIYYFKCHRDGFYKSAGKNLRHLKLQGSNKINGYCPSRMDVSVYKTGKVCMQFLWAHVGHGMDLGRIPLKKSDRDLLASKISQKIPFDELINNVRDQTMKDNYSRIHLLTKKDLFNIKQLYNIRKEPVDHTNESTVVESWITQLSENGNDSIVKYLKQQGELDENFEELQNDDFLLIVINEGQLEALKNYGNDCIYVDCIQGLNAHDFQLTTLMVLDDIRQEFPCLFAFSNRSDMQVMKVIFEIIKNLLGKEISPKVFMSDINDSFYNAWHEVMGRVDVKIFCAWHVLSDWKKHINSKIRDVKKQKITQKNLKALLEEPNNEVFEEMLPTCIYDLYNDPDLHDFANYFKDHYVESKESWAYCYRQHVDVNIDVHLEKMQKTIKDTYIKSQKEGGIAVTISAVMKIVRDTLFEHLVILNKGKITKKLSELRKRHKLVTSIENLIAMIEVEEGKSWTVNSLNGETLYTIEILNKECKCNLRCDECKTCIHAYTCSCPDSALRRNMCKHIHYLCTLLPEPDSTDTNDIVEDTNMSDTNVIMENANMSDADDIMENTNISDADDIMEDTNISDTMENTNMSDSNEQNIDHIKQKYISEPFTSSSYTPSDSHSQYKRKLAQMFQNIINFANSEEQYRVIEEALAPLQSTLALMNSDTLC